MTPLPQLIFHQKLWDVAPPGSSRPGSDSASAGPPPPAVAVEGYSCPGAPLLRLPRPVGMAPGGLEWMVSSSDAPRARAHTHTHTQGTAGAWCVWLSHNCNCAPPLSVPSPGTQHQPPTLAVRTVAKQQETRSEKQRRGGGGV